MINKKTNRILAFFLCICLLFTSLIPPQTFALNSAMLKYLDLRGCSGLNIAIDLSGCVNLEEVYTKGRKPFAYHYNHILRSNTSQGHRAIGCIAKHRNPHFL